MPFPGRENPGTLVVVDDQNEPLRVGVTVVSTVTGIEKSRVQKLAVAGKLPYLVDGSGFRAFDLVRVFEILLAGQIVCKALRVGQTDDATDMAWAYDALMGGLGRVGRKAPSARAVTWVLDAVRSEKDRMKIVDWGNRRLLVGITDQQIASTRSEMQTRKRAGEAIKLVVASGPSAAEKWKAEQDRLRS